MDLENKVATSKPLVKSLSAKNKMLKNKVAILTTEAENDKECVATLEKSLQVEKDFCKLKDKQIGDLKLKLQNVRATTVQDFKDSNEYFEDLCKYCVEDFDLLVKWMTKYHLGLDLSGLAVDDVKKELMSDHPFEATAENVTEEATDATEVMKEAPTNPVLMSNNLFFFSFQFFISFQGKNNISHWARCFGQLNNSFDDDR